MASPVPSLLWFRASDFVDGQKPDQETYDVDESTVCEHDPDIIVCTQQYEPVCGQLPTGVRGSDDPSDSRRETFPNGCELELSGAVYLYEGECEFIVDEPFVEEENPPHEEELPLEACEFHIDERGCELEVCNGEVVGEYCPAEPAEAESEGQEEEMPLFEEEPPSPSF